MRRVCAQRSGGRPAAGWRRLSAAAAKQTSARARVDGGARRPHARTIYLLPPVPRAFPGESGRALSVTSSRSNSFCASRSPRHRMALAFGAGRLDRLASSSRSHGAPAGVLRAPCVRAPPPRASMRTSSASRVDGGGWARSTLNLQRPQRSLVARSSLVPSGSSAVSPEPLPEGAARRRRAEAAAAARVHARAN